MPEIRSQETALKIMPHFAEAVLAGRVHAYGYYAKRIGLNPATNSMQIGPAMHLIGAACAFSSLPIAPLHFVERFDGEWRGIFEKDALEATSVLPHYNTLYVAAREYDYTEADFKKISHNVGVINEVKALKNYPRTPHRLWHLVVVTKLRGSSGETYLQNLSRISKAIIEAKRPGN